LTEQNEELKAMNEELEALRSFHWPIKSSLSGETRRQQSSGDGTRMKNERVNYEMSVQYSEFCRKLSSVVEDVYN